LTPYLNRSPSLVLSASLSSPDIHVNLNLLRSANRPANFLTPTNQIVQQTTENAKEEQKPQVNPIKVDTETNKRSSLNGTSRERTASDAHTHTNRHGSLTASSPTGRSSITGKSPKVGPKFVSPTNKSAIETVPNPNASPFHRGGGFINRRGSIDWTIAMQSALPSDVSAADFLN
jgi:hypothetical protein